MLQIEGTDDIDCNFEEDQCTWFQDPSVSFRWTKTQEASVDSSAGPSSDHTTGGTAGLTVLSIHVKNGIVSNRPKSLYTYNSLLS